MTVLDVLMIVAAVNQTMAVAAAVRLTLRGVLGRSLLPILMEGATLVAILWALVELWGVD